MSSIMTRKEKTMHENTLVMNLLYDFACNWRIWDTHWKRLYNCNAKVGYDGRYYMLRSYNTIIAIYDTKNNVLIDVLCYRYRYTATSRQHIAKFQHYLRYGFLFYRDIFPVVYTYR